MKAKRFIISGRVQGVNFRYFTERVAHSLAVTGWVRNLYDGRVEALAQGEEKHIDIFFEKMKEGPPAAMVTDVQVSEVPVDPDLKSFRVTF